MSVNYSIIQSEQGSIAVQSTVKSFNLDHITEKDIVSFYTRFSQYSAWDTGLLPVEGTGTLSIRTAGIYTQFAYQHKPGLHHINWGKSEGASAAAYYLAQPYRIIICDMKDGNLLGARMFYSPYPITSPTQPLYHVNLPNINCKGYRGNGVGWICLYQNEDWSHLPLNERIVRFIERCSGVETYNDANMSETDGTRFYQENSKPEYFWNPVAWEKKSSEEGFEWTLDENLLIPVLVQSMDKQGQHYSNGKPLTFADALVGDYQSYYYDEEHTKPINAIIRPDKQLNASDVLSFFVTSYNGANDKHNPLLDNTFESSQKIKNDVGSTIFGGSVLTNAPASHNNDDDNDEDNGESEYCESCDSYYHQDDVSADHYGNTVCSGCLDSESYVYIKSTDTYFSSDDSNLVYSELLDKSFHTTFDSVQVCENCDSVYGSSGKENPVNKVIELDNGDQICPASGCVQNHAYKHDLETTNCFTCQTTVINDLTLSSYFITTNVSVPYYNFDTNQNETNIVKATFCTDCSQSHLICPCGLIKLKSDEGFNECNAVSLDLNNSKVKVNKACSTCVSFNFDEEGQMYANFTPVSMPTFNSFQTSLNHSSSIHNGFVNSSNLDEEPF
jgi:hypothetical protein